MPRTINPNQVKAAGTLLKQKTVAPDEDAAKVLVDSQESPGAFYYNKFLKTTFIKIFDASKDITVEVVF